MFRFFQYLVGYLKIKVYGLSPQRFINLCSKNGIILWDIVPCEDCYIMEIGLRQFFRIRSIARKTRTRAVVIEKCGLPFLLPKINKRKAFIFGLLICLFIYKVFGIYIWDCDISGNISVSKEQIINCLKDNNYVLPMKKADTNTEVIEKILKNNFENITWASVTLDGIRMTIRVKEKNTENFEDKIIEGCSDIVADFDGIITKMIVREGIGNKSIGDSVSSGDILVEGNVPIYSDDGNIKDYVNVEADADIYIEHSIHYQQKLPQKDIKRAYTGRNRKKIYINIFGNNMIYYNSNKYLYYDIIRDYLSISFLNKYEIPVFFIKETKREYQNIEFIYGEESAKEKLYSNYNIFIDGLMEKDIQIIQKSVKIDLCENFWVMDADIVVNEKVSNNVTVSPKRIEEIVVDE